MLRSSVLSSRSRIMNTDPKSSVKPTLPSPALAVPPGAVTLAPTFTVCNQRLLTASNPAANAAAASVPMYVKVKIGG